MSSVGGGVVVGSRDGLSLMASMAVGGGGGGKGSKKEEVAGAPRLRRGVAEVGVEEEELLRGRGPSIGSESDLRMGWGDSLCLRWRGFWRAHWWRVAGFVVTVVGSVVITSMVARTIEVPWEQNHLYGHDKHQTWSEHQLSVILMSFKRPQEVEKIVKHYAGLDMVGELIVFNNNLLETDLTPLAESIPKLLVLQTANDLGVHTRFSAGTLATHEAILFQDDDVLLSAEAIHKLLSEFHRHPLSIHGIWGRWPTRSNPYRPGEIPPDFTRAPIVLTRAFVVNKAHMGTFWVAAPHLDFLAASATPRWNGEDILFSLSICAANNGTLHYIYPELNKHVTALTEAYAISGNWGVHGPYREAFTIESFRVLGLELKENVADYGGNQDGTPLRVQNGIDIKPPDVLLPK